MKRRRFQLVQIVHWRSDGVAALADTPTGTILLQNAQVGVPHGNLGESRMVGIGSWTLDGNMGKTFRISESKSIQIRVDATNVFNHPQPAQPNFAVSGTTDFGQISTKGGIGNGSPRAFQGQLRFSF
jgi:hypothetical protein